MTPSFPRNGVSGHAGAVHTDIGGTRWSVEGLRDLVTIQLARMTDHPAWTTLTQALRPTNTIDFKIHTLKFNAA